MRKPKYSIAIPAHERPEYLFEAVRSGLLQTDRDLEIVVSDDCSNADLEAVSHKFGDSRVRFERSSERLGAVRNHARAVELSRGEYVITLNSDDMLLPSALQVCGQTLEERRSAGAVFFSLMNWTGERVDGCDTMPALGGADAAIFAQNPWLEKFHGTSPSRCVFRRAAYDRIGGYRTSLRFAYDWEFYIRMMVRGGGVVFLPKVLGVYRRHPEQMVQTSSINAIRDMLLLWRTAEFRHWTSSEIADLFFLEIRNRQLRRMPLAPVVQEFLAQPERGRLIRGLGRVLVGRVKRRLGGATGDPIETVVPADLDSAVRAFEGMRSAPHFNRVD